MGTCDCGVYADDQTFVKKEKDKEGVLRCPSKESLEGRAVVPPAAALSVPAISYSSIRMSYFVLAEMKVDKGKHEFLKLEQEFGFEDDGEYVHWFKLLKFPSFENSDRVEIKFKSQTPLKSFAVNTTGIRKASYVAEQVCNSPVTIQQTVSRREKI